MRIEFNTPPTVARITTLHDRMVRIERAQMSGGFYIADNVRLARLVEIRGRASKAWQRACHRRDRYRAAYGLA